MILKSTLTLLFVFLTSAFATSPDFEYLTKPLYYPGANNMAGKDVAYVSVPKLMNSTYPLIMAGTYEDEVYFSGRDSEHNLNLISVYGLKITANELAKPGDEGESTIIFLIKTDEAKKPANYPFSIEEVVIEAAACINKDYPESKIVAVTKGNSA